MSSEDQTKFKAQILPDVRWVGNGLAQSKGQKEKKHLAANMKPTSGTLIFLLLHFRNVFGKQFAQINNSGRSDMMYVINSCALGCKEMVDFQREKTFSATD